MARIFAGVVALCALLVTAPAQVINVVAGGGFGLAGGVSAMGLARYDGTQWYAFGATEMWPASAVVSADPAQPATFLAAGGFSGCAALWNATASSWKTLSRSCVRSSQRSTYLRARR